VYMDSCPKEARDKLGVQYKLSLIGSRQEESWGSWRPWDVHRHLEFLTHMTYVYSALDTSCLLCGNGGCGRIRFKSLIRLPFLPISAWVGGRKKKVSFTSDPMDGFKNLSTSCL
jgi:hypothetical protein